MFLDVNRLKSLVKTITLKEFAQKCSDGIDGYFLARQKSVRYNHQLDRLKALEILRKFQCSVTEVVLHPVLIRY